LKGFGLHSRPPFLDLSWRNEDWNPGDACRLHHDCVDAASINQSTSTALELGRAGATPRSRNDQWRVADLLMVDDAAFAMQLGSQTPIAVRWLFGQDDLDLFGEPCLGDAWRSASSQHVERGAPSADILLRLRPSLPAAASTSDCRRRSHPDCRAIRLSIPRGALHAIVAQRAILPRPSFEHKIVPDGRSAPSSAPSVVGDVLALTNDDLLSWSHECGTHRSRRR